MSRFHKLYPFDPEAAGAARRVGIRFGGHVSGIDAAEASDSRVGILDHLNTSDGLDTLCMGDQRKEFWVGKPLGAHWLRVPELAAAAFTPDADSLLDLELVQRVGMPILAGTDMNVGPDHMWGSPPGLALHPGPTRKPRCRSNPVAVSGVKETVPRAGDGFADRSVVRPIGHTPRPAAAPRPSRERGLAGAPYLVEYDDDPHNGETGLRAAILYMRRGRAGRTCDGPGV